MKITQVFKNSLVATVVAGAMLLAPSVANAGVFVSVGIAPPAIPVYEQPLAPGYGYIWTPGYWAYGDDGYYWVDGAWVEPPYAEALWTPGYWGWGDGGYFWNPGYWGRHIGYYGGINYGFGYFGTGFYGGYWNGGHFFYNGAYNHIGFHNGFIYNHRVEGFDGRPGGVAFTRNEGGFNHGGENFNRGSAINGRGFGDRGGEGWNRGQDANRGGFANRGEGNFNRGGEYGNHIGNDGPRQAYTGDGTRGSSPTFAGRGNNPVPSQERPYAGGGHVEPRSVPGGNFGGGARPNFSGGPSGGGFHGGGGAGGGFHGGGGGRR